VFPKNIRQLIFLVIVFETIVLGTAIFLGVLRNKPLAHFGERKFVTVVSVLQLLVIAWLAYRIWQIRRVPGERPWWKSPTSIWLLMAVGFVFLGVDEFIGIHESIDKRIHKLFHLRETGWTDRIDDMLVALYGLVGIGTIFAYRRELVQYKKVIPYLVTGFFMFFVMVVLDTATNRCDLLVRVFGGECEVLRVWLSVAEDSMKVIAEAVFGIGYYACLLIATGLGTAKAENGLPAKHAK
jgi:hypothetical protein